MNMMHKMFVVALSVVGLLVPGIQGCGGNQQRVPEAIPVDAVEGQVSITETTQLKVANHLVAPYNFGEDTYEGPGGPVTGVRGTFSVQNLETMGERNLRLAAGDILPLGGERYEILRFVREDGKLGAVVLKKLVDGPGEAASQVSDDELSEEDRDNAALSDCLGMCDMAFHCRAEIAASVGEEGSVVLMGDGDDMEVCHGKCMDRIRLLSKTAFQLSHES